MGDISKNYNRYEFRCRCGCGSDTVDTELIKVMQEIRDHFNKPVDIHCGHRCIEHNANVGGVSTSQHLSGRACDFHINGVEPLEIADWINEKYPDKYGIGNYKTFTHLDTRSGKPARWNG